MGGAVVRLAKNRGRTVWAPCRSDLDLSDPATITSALAGKRLTAVINCAAYTAVDRAETEPYLAMRVNGLAPTILAQETARRQIPMIHVSTDYVFDGSKDSPYVEGDPVNPVSVYGKTKEAGEAGVRANNPNHAIVRTAWVLSATGANFLNTMLRLGQERSEVSVVADQLGCPTGAGDIAAALIEIADTLGDRGGTWHFVNRGTASWHSLAEFIFVEAERRGVPKPALKAIMTADYPTPALRPANSRLATGLVERDFCIKPQSWQDTVKQILTERLG